MKILTLLLIVFFASCAVPNTPVTLYMKNGKVRKGFATQNPYKKLKFKKDRRDKSVIYKLDQFSMVEYHTDKGIQRYVKLPVEDREDKILVQEIVAGNVSLYTSNRVAYNPGVSTRFNAVGMPMGFGGYRYSIDHLYLKRRSELELTYLVFNQLFTKNFVKAVTEYFKDCPKLVALIKQKYYRKKDLKDIVTFYNRKCK